MANPKYIFKLTPNEKQVIINSSVILNGYPDVEYPVPFIQTSQLGYIIDQTTFKFIDPSILQDFEFPYPVRLEVELDYQTLPFYAVNKEKHCDRIVFSDGLINAATDVDLHKRFQKSKNNEYDQSAIFIRYHSKPSDEYLEEIDSSFITGTNVYDVLPFRFNFKLYWSDNVGHTAKYGHLTTDMGEIDFNQPIDALGGIYPFEVRITPKMEPSVIDQYDTFLMPQLDPNDYPPALTPTEEQTESFETVYGYINENNMLSSFYEVNMYEVDNIISWLRRVKTRYLRNNPDRVKFLKEYLIRDINNRNVQKRKYEAQNIPVAVINSSTYITSIDYPDTETINVYKTEDHQLVEKKFTSYSPWISVPDNRETNHRDVVTFEVRATFTDPRTLLSVDLTQSFTVQQRAYPGDRRGYIKMRYLDNTPLELWSPKVQPVYGKSKGDEANVKVNKNLNTEFLGFIVDDSLNIADSDIKNIYGFAKLYKKNILPTVFIDPSDGVEKTINSSNINYVVHLAETNFDFYNKYVNILPIYDVSIMNYYYNPDPELRDSSIFSDYDFNNFKRRYEWCKDIGADDNMVCVQYPKEQQALIDYGLYDSAGNYINTSLYVDISTHHVEFAGRYIARYARYKIVNKEYYQIIIQHDVLSGNGNFVDPQFGVAPEGDKDYDGTFYDVTHIGNFNFIDNNSQIGWENQTHVYGAEYTTNNSFTPNSSTYVQNIAKDKYTFIAEPADVTNYKIIIGNDGNSVQYKFCVNELLYDGSILDKDNTNVSSYIDVQSPRFGVYGKYLGLFAYDFDVYDYTSDLIPFQDLSENNIVIQSGKDSINDINILIDTDLHVSGETRHDITTVVPVEQHEATIAIYGASKKSVNKGILGAGNNDIPDSSLYTTLTFKNVPSDLLGKLRVNGQLLSDPNGTVKHEVEPYIYMISIDEFPEEYTSYIVDLDLNGEDCSLLITNDENEKHLRNYTNKGTDIDTNLDSFMVLRTNPKLTGNIKLVVDTDYNIYLDTFKATPVLNDQRYRRQAVPADGNYPYDVKRVFATLPNTELFKVPENSLKAHKVYNDFNNQYETMYEYGAETNTDNLYPENMKILAPLHIGKDVPDFFTIFRYDEVIDNNTYSNEDYIDIDKFKELIANAEVVKTYDLRQYTSIGQYLNNYKNMLTNYGQCYLQFIEQDHYKQSPAYRQGTNIWKGISINRGILTNQSETSYFANKILDSSLINKQEVFNNFIMQGFERNNLLYPNIINLEFMFNDNSQEEYSMHRYFGLYLTENDFIKYGYVIPDQTRRNHLNKYDVNGNIYVGDNEIYNKIFNSKYASRLFYAVTNDYADRVKTEDDVNDFLSAYIKNTPEKNMFNIKADEIHYKENDKSFITLHFSEPLKYGEHIKFIALNKPLDDTAYTQFTDPEGNQLSYEHIVFEIIASNNEYLKYTEDYISPVENYNDCVYSENTSFYRLAFYSQDLDYPEVSASIEDQIQRIVSCIKQFNTFIHVGNYNKNSISIFSEYDEMYLQHIDSHDFDDFKYDYVYVKDNNFIAGQTLYTTNDVYTDSISFIVQDPEIVKVENYDQAQDEYNDWLKADDINQNNTKWTCYVEAEDPANIKYDSISYFNAFEKYEMHALTNQSDYFDGYYASFCNYGFETIGWRYNTVVKFLKVSELKNNYSLYNNEIYNFVKKIKYPIVMTDDNMYETIQLFNVSTGYLRNNIMDPDIYEQYTSVQQLIFTNKEFQVITSPYDVNYSMIMSIGDALLKNNMVQLYKPKYANISIMGISNVKDIDTIIDAVRPLENKEHLTVYAEPNETLYLDESDYRIQHGVMYELINGILSVNYTNGGSISSTDITAVCKFIILPDKNNSFVIYYNYNNGLTGVTSEIGGVNYLTAKSSVEIKIIDKQKYQEYDYTTFIPLIKSDNLFKDPANTDNSELLYPITPQVNCNWKSNGQYFDFNNTLDVSNFRQDYEYEGNFVENVYTPSLYETNQYVTNKIDSVVYIDGKQTTYRNAILNGECQHPIKKLLIDNKNIDTAMAYYNSNIQSLEFIFSGIKFEIKLNSKLVNTHIHLDAYDNFEVFVINDYDLSKNNELFISMQERFILLINHSFYIDYAHEAVNNIKTIRDDLFQAYQDYSAFWAPYSMDMRTFYKGNQYPVVHRKNLHKSLMDAIDPHNMWSSYFVQMDIPIFDIQPNTFYTNMFKYTQSPYISISEYGNYVTFNKDKTDISNFGYTEIHSSDNIFLRTYDLSVLGNNVLSPKHQYSTTKTDSYPYVVTKADGDYNSLAKKLVKGINKKIKKVKQDLITEYTQEEVNGGTGGLFGGSQNDPILGGPSFPNNPVLNDVPMDILSMRRLTNDDIGVSVDEDLFATYDENEKNMVKELSSMLETPFFWLITQNHSISKYRNYYIPKPYLAKLQEYIEILLVGETNQEKLQRYVKSFNDNVDIYIIPVDTPVQFIENSVEYNPLIFKLSIPNMIKYNYGWFTPNTVRMLDFTVDDELRDILDLDLLQSNTNISGINRIINYTGNKVFDDNILYTLKHNYFLIDNKSLLSTTWDGKFYRKYTTEENYNYYDGHITGIDDKSFFGSRCMVMHHEYIQISKWEYNTANDILTYKLNDSQFNTESNNTQNTVITINMTAAIFNHFINNRAFAENWNFFADTQYTGMKNYINNTLTSYFNMFSNIEVIVYKKDTVVNAPINILLDKPADINNYSVIEGLNVSEPEIKEDFYTITIVIPYSTGMDIYPVIKIYRR